MATTTAMATTAPTMATSKPARDDAKPSRWPTSASKLTNTLLHPLETIYLFSKSDITTFILPNTAFGLLTALATTPVPALTILSRTPLLLLYNWLNVFIFELANQRLPPSIREDALNKPWRPLPTNRLSPTTVRRLLLALIPLTLLTNNLLGTPVEGTLLLVLDWMYNDLGGGDELSRDAIIAAAFALYNAGSASIAAARPLAPRALAWTALVSLNILTTMQVQDLSDQAGDRTRNRQTAPLVLGDSVSRGVVAVFVSLGTVLCAVFWRAGVAGWLLAGGAGLNVVVRVLARRDREADRKTWKMWSAWLVALYALPLVAKV